MAGVATNLSEVVLRRARYAGAELSCSGVPQESSRGSDSSERVVAGLGPGEAGGCSDSN